jgi:hypothetical protein
MDNERLDICEECAWDYDFQSGPFREEKKCVCEACRRAVAKTEAKYKRETGGLAIELAPVEQEAAE